MDRQNEILRERLQTGFLGIIAFAILLFMLVQARFMLICLAIAIIIFSLTSDAISAIARRRVPNWLATTLALLLIGTGLLWASATVVSQVNEVVTTAVSYAEQMQAALPALLEWLGPEAQSTVDTAIRNANVTGWMRSAASGASDLLAAAVLIFLFVGFMFAERVWFPLKIESLLDDDAAAAARVRQIIASIMRRVNRYLVVKTLVSGVTAGFVWVIFTTAGLPLAVAIALLTFALNFIPSIGSVIATIIAVVMAYVLSADLTTSVAVGAACTAVQFAIGNVLDPMLLGQTLRLSSFGIILSLAFWGAIWGLPGMFLAVPIMVAVMIVCAHIPWLRPIAILLSREGHPDDGLTDEDAAQEPETEAGI
ncbi:Predicted PurR-regulated permease PerM [Paracoccus isoporae]|uniref:Predicted PurR-regulated permease PerM n=1 Tax=Paracoccus isoporae TaxID=591205 RepID=A0A1G7ENN8_9RHOB|nr:AI-2E family transporter [Paracoccus isoporae]SDE65259.1 Predicted PurR-regulated permease PerM [Paracoccus isoporae]